MRLKRILPVILLASSATPVIAGVAELRDAFSESIEPDKRARHLAELAQTAPQSPRDVQALFDLFSRFDEAPVRNSALSSLSRMSPHSPLLEPVFARYLEEPEPEARIFAIKGALRLRAQSALPLIKRLARENLAFKSPQDAQLISEKNAWWVQYEALAALAQWEPAQALPLIKAKASDAPEVAKLMGLFLWKESLPQIIQWSGSKKPEDRERAKQALTVPTPAAALRETRTEMLKILRDPKADPELRHQIALKVGLSSNEEEVGALLKEYEGLPTADAAKDKLYFSAALFASHSPQAIPVLVEHVKTHPNPATRSGALLQLKDMLPEAEYRALLDWASKNDPDLELREEALQQLKAGAASKPR
ncbi:MAG: hypothetical protein HY921_02855 [Elusimicrobia bacterium]|nr:hypothetical protein [Elusimicrobiota bacterium]